MKVETAIEEADVDADYGTVFGLIVTCKRCGHSVKAGGAHEGSAARAAAMLRDECPRGERNFYVTPGFL